jgi:hypothetical protein
MSDRDLLRHELAHALGGILACPGTVATIQDDGDTWSTTHEWPDPATVGEWPVVASFVAGPFLVPEHASIEDTLFVAALPQALREKAEAFARDVVAPALADIGSFELTAMLAQIRSTGGIRIKRGQMQ